MVGRAAQSHGAFRCGPGIKAEKKAAAKAARQVSILQVDGNHNESVGRNGGSPHRSLDSPPPRTIHCPFPSTSLPPASPEKSLLVTPRVMFRAILFNIHA